MGILTISKPELFEVLLPRFPHDSVWVISLISRWSSHRMEGGRKPHSYSKPHFSPEPKWDKTRGTVYIGQSLYTRLSSQGKGNQSILNQCMVSNHNKTLDMTLGRSYKLDRSILFKYRGSSKSLSPQVVPSSPLLPFISRQFNILTE